MSVLCGLARLVARLPKIRPIPNRAQSPVAMSQPAISSLMPGSVAPAFMSTSKPGDPSAFMMTTVQSPSSKAQEIVCGPVPVLVTGAVGTAACAQFELAFGEVGEAFFGRS